MLGITAVALFAEAGRLFFFHLCFSSIQRLSLRISSGRVSKSRSPGKPDCSVVLLDGYGTVCVCCAPVTALPRSVASDSTFGCWEM